LTCQEETEKVPPEAVVQEQAEVPEWVDLVREGWVAPEQVQALEGSASARNAGLLFLMRPESPVTTKAVQNVAQRWCEDNSQF
jgi:hypothetical protein